MNSDVILWLFGTVITLQTVVLGAFGTVLWTHLRDCNGFRVDQARMLGQIAADLKRVQLDIGDHESGLRGQVHRLASDITPYIVRRQVDRE